jgi:hypothetical protein
VSNLGALVLNLLCELPDLRLVCAFRVLEAVPSQLLGLLTAKRLTFRTPLPDLRLMGRHGCLATGAYGAWSVRTLPENVRKGMTTQGMVRMRGTVVEMVSHPRSAISHKPVQWLVLVLGKGLEPRRSFSQRLTYVMELPLEPIDLPCDNCMVFVLEIGQRLPPLGLMRRHCLLAGSADGTRSLRALPENLCEAVTAKGAVAAWCRIVEVMRGPGATVSHEPMQRFVHRDRRPLSAGVKRSIIRFPAMGGSGQLTGASGLDLRRVPRRAHQPNSHDCPNASRNVTARG